MLEWQWQRVITRLDGSCLLVADKEFIKHIKSRGVTGDLVMRDCATYQGKIPPKIKNALVFCRKGELPLVRKLREKYPDKTIVSGTYEFSMLPPDGVPKLGHADLQSSGVAERSSQPLVMLSAPYGAADYLSRLITDASGLQFTEHLGRPMLDWMRLADGFQASRFFANAERLSGPNGTFATLLLTDVLDTVLTQTNTRTRHVIRTLNNRGAKVLLLRHPARFDHAFASELLERSRLRFYAQTPAGKPHPVNPSKVTMLATLRWATALARQEALLDEMNDGLDTVLEIDADDLRHQPDEHLARVTDFLGVSIKGDASAQPYADYTRPVKGLHEFTLSMKRQLVDQFGLHTA